MKINLFKASIVGYKNIKRSSNSQDYCDYKEYEDIGIYSVADGHSLPRFKYSDIGAKLACKAVEDVIDTYINDDKEEDIINDFEDGIIQHKIKISWDRLVYNHFYTVNYKAYRLNTGLYGTTLTSVILIKNNIIFFNLGDGKILIKEGDDYDFVFENNNHIIVNSMCQNICESKMQLKIINKEDKDIKIVICSDGFTNSFMYYDDLKREIDNTFNSLNSNVFIKYKFEKNYTNHLNELSKSRCFDDISVMYIYK